MSLSQLFGSGGGLLGSGAAAQAQQPSIITSPYIPAGQLYIGGGGFIGMDFALGQVPEPPVVLVIGPYKLERRAGHDNYPKYVLCHGRTEKKRVVCSWPGRAPSRRTLAAVIREDRKCLPRKNARDEYGALQGVRLFALSGDFYLQSPTQMTVWESSVLSVPTWDEQQVVRGTCGIHAAWPPRAWEREPLIDHPNKELVVAVVRGMGKYVTGDEGWRAEKVIVDRVFLPAAYWQRWRVKKRLAALYPEISFEEEPWTLEKSLRSAK